MNNNEVFAYNIGMMARLYIDFKNEVEEKNSSLRDMLTYSKYDRETLRFVLRRICQGTNLTKAKEEKRERLLRYYQNIHLTKKLRIKMHSMIIHTFSTKGIS